MHENCTKSKFYYLVNRFVGHLSWLVLQNIFKHQINIKSRKGLPIKDIRNQGGCPLWTFCGHGEEGSFNTDVQTFVAKKLTFFKSYNDADVQTLVLQKIQRFSKVIMWQHGQGEEGLFFALLCGRVLWTAPNWNVKQKTTTEKLASLN